MKLGLPTGVDTPLGRRLAALTLLRLTALALLLAIIEVYYLRALPFGGYSTVVGVTTVGSAFLLSALFTALLRSGRRLRLVAYAQLATDQLTWTAVAYISGGVTSGSTSLYGLTCLFGAVLVGTSGAVWSAGFGIVSYLALCLGFASGVLPPPPDQFADAYVVESSAMIYPAFSTVVATGLVASLASYLAERLRTYGGRLEEATKRAEEAEHLAALGRLSAALAHEIRNPLGSIRGSVELLRTGGGLTKEDERLCVIVEREAERLNDLVTDMVDLSRPRPPELHEVDLAQTARNVVELARGSARGQDIRVTYVGPEQLVVRADQAQMRQMLWNLVRNALQASEDGAEVRVALERDDEEVLMQVDDDGSGIPPSKRDHIFDAFYTTRSHGVGIGLAVVKRICDDHGFHIDIDSAEGKGTSFSVRLPKASVVAALAFVLGPSILGCGGGQDWVRSEDTWWADERLGPSAPSAEPSDGSSAPAAAPVATVAVTGTPLEIYRNTYYDFPQETASSIGGGGEKRELFDASCQLIRNVPREFHDAVCVQGSGRLSTGQTVSFVRRDCECAAICPRTDQKICFDVLDQTRFPWGRGATGGAITPLRTVAVDPKEIPLGTTLYIPEYHGLRGPDGKAHDGCFVAEDRGLKVVGKHVDVFTGNPTTTKSWNQAVPSNQGVKVVVGASRCAHLVPPPPKEKPKKDQDDGSSSG